MSLTDRLRPRVYSARYPGWMVGRPLLYMSSALASLGDAMFGYGQGIIAAVQVQPSFIHRMFGKTVTLAQIQDGNTGVDPWVQGWFSFLYLRHTIQSPTTPAQPSQSHA